MTSTLSSAPTPIANNAAQSANSASSSASGTTSPAVPAARSYASATAASKKQTTAPAIASSTPSVAAGGSAPAQNGKSTSISPVNGKGNIQPAVPQVGAPAIANGAPGQNEHNRNSSVTIPASGNSGYMPNGGAVGAASHRPNINFGSMTANGSPAIANSTPHQSHANLSAPQNNPRITSPANSPSPIPQPLASSGGRPPSSLQGQGNGLSFGAMGGDGTDQVCDIKFYNSESLANKTSQLRAPSMPQGPAGQHLRRESSTSSQNGEMGPAGMNTMNRGFPPNGRGRGFPPSFDPRMNSPNMAYRNMQPMQPRTPQNMPQFPNQGRVPSSPYQNRASPALQPAQMAHMPYGGYQQHLQPHQQQVKPPSHSRQHSHSAIKDSKNTAPQQQHKPVSFSASSRFSNQHQGSDFTYNFDSPNFEPANGAYDQYLTFLSNQMMYGMPQQFDPNYQYYAANPYMHAGMPPYQGAPPSPRPNFNAPHGVPQSYMQGQYGSPANTQMARTPSQGP
ncbi:hypothetical protein LTS18_012417, partial [Coniosporium uncinatum]